MSEPVIKLDHAAIIHDQNKLRAKQQDARKADRYIGRDGGAPKPDPDLDPIGGMSPAEYGRYREELASKTGVAKALLDEEYHERRKAHKDDSIADTFMADPEPWPDPVDGDDLLDKIADVAREHVVLPDGGAETIALWIVHAHAHDCFDCSPFLAVTSPVHECGKSTVLRLVESMVPKALPASNISPSSLFRAIDKWGPTLLIDEADSYLPDNEALRGILNAGHAKGAFVVRTVGDNHEPQRFSTWAPKAIALIGRLAPTLASRSIHLELRRKQAAEKVTRLRIGKSGHLKPLMRQAARWTSDHADELREADPKMPGLDGRIEDNWRPLIAIADLAGGTWPATARRIAAKGSIRNEETAAIVLLGDLRAMFADRGVDRLTSKEIVNRLSQMEDREWPEWKQGKPLTQTQLARLLKPFGIGVTTVRGELERGKGYNLSAFQDTFRSYLPPFEA